MQISLVQQAHEAVAKVLSQGDIAVDATVGNGHDTVFLAERVGADGHVFGMDLQRSALLSTGARLSENGLSSRVTLIEGSHEDLLQQIPRMHHGLVKAVMFNLGYLPGSDKTVITKARCTIPALRAALSILAPRGCLSILAYPGHPGGREETEAVRAWTKEVEDLGFHVSASSVVHTRRTPPEWIFIRNA